MQINNCQITTEFGEGSPVLFYPSPEEGQTMTIHAEVVLEVFQGGTFVETDAFLEVEALARSGRRLLEQSSGLLEIPPGTSEQVEFTVDASGLARPPEVELGPPWSIGVQGYARIREDDPIAPRLNIDCGTVTAQAWPEPPEGTLQFASCSSRVDLAEVGATPIPLEAEVFNSSFPGVRAGGDVVWRVEETGATLASRPVDVGGGELATTVSATPTLLDAHVGTETEINLDASIENLHWVGDPTSAAPRSAAVNRRLRSQV